MMAFTACTVPRLVIQTQWWPKQVLNNFPGSENKRMVQLKECNVVS